MATKITPFSLAKSRKRRNTAPSTIAQPPNKRHCSQPSHNASSDSNAKSKPKPIPSSSIKKKTSKRKKLKNEEVDKIIREIDDKHGKYCTKSGGKAVKIWKGNGDARNRMKCLVCEQYPMKAHSGMTGNNVCKMALPEGQVFNMDTLIGHYEGSSQNRSHEIVINHIKYLEELETINHQLMGTMNDNGVTNLKIRNCFNIILDKKKKRLYYAILRVMCGEYMAAKSPTDSTYNSIGNNLLESYYMQVRDLRNADWIDFEGDIPDFIYNRIFAFSCETAVLKFRLQTR